MKILIGTPIHISKDYAMERWIQNVSNLQRKSPADLLLVDNSPETDYVKKIKGYCQKHGIKNYHIKYLEIDPELRAIQRIGRSQETIRQYLLSRDFDAWFSWECDQIIPVDALNKLVRLMAAGGYGMVCHGSPARIHQPQSIAAFGVTLIKREVLEKYGFLLEHPDTGKSKYAGENWLKKQILISGGNYIEVHGVINPIYHLNE